MPNKLWNISDITTIIVVICVLFGLYTGFVWIQNVMPFFFVACGIVLFGSITLYTGFMFVSKAHAQWKLDANGAKKTTARRIEK